MIRFNVTKVGYGAVVDALRNGKRAMRSEWSDAFLFMVTSWKPLTYGGNVVMAVLREPSPFIAMRTADQGVMPWHVNSADTQANDWMISE